MPTLFTHILPITICLTGVYLAFRSEMLRDVVVKPGGDYRKVPFSFARTQLLWWVTHWPTPSTPHLLGVFFAPPKTAAAGRRFC